MTLFIRTLAVMSLLCITGCAANHDIILGSDDLIHHVIEVDRACCKRGCTNAERLDALARVYSKSRTVKRVVISKKGDLIVWYKDPLFQHFPVHIPLNDCAIYVDSDSL